MRSIKKRLALGHIVLIVGIAAIAIPVAAGISSTAIAVVNERQGYAGQETGTGNENGDAKHAKDSKAAVGRGLERRQDDYYDLRREHWEDRLEGRLDYRDEYLEEHGGDDDDKADAEDSKAGKDDQDDTVDQEHDIYERRREYWRQRLDKEW